MWLRIKPYNNREWTRMGAKEKDEPQINADFGLEAESCRSESNPNSTCGETFFFPNLLQLRNGICLICF
jgi:hypothetical protein